LTKLAEIDLSRKAKLNEYIYFGQKTCRNDNFDSIYIFNTYCTNSFE
jgi:hypothetical protein